MAKTPTAPAFPFARDEIVESVEAFWAWGPRGDVFVKLGARLRADEDVVQRHPEKFVRDGSTDAEKQRALETAHPYQEPEPHTPFITRPEPLRDENAVLCTQNVRANADGDAHLARSLVVAVGQKVGKDERIVTQFPDSFVPVVAAGLTPQNAVRAKGDTWEYRKDGNGNYIREDDGQLKLRYGEFRRFLVHRAGTWVNRQDADVQTHPQAYEVITDV
jgi:hypothetical protein